jgi:sodium/proline symporter
LFWRNATRAGAIAGMVTGFVIAVGWNEVYDASATGVELYNLPVAFLAALSVNVFVSLACWRDDLI